MIPSNRKVSLEREIFPIHVKDQKLAGFPFTGDWFDIGNFSDYRRANFSLLAKRQFRNKQIEHPNNAHVRSPVLLGQDSRIEKGATAGPRLIAGKKTVLGIRSRVSHSILFDNVAIGEGSRVTGAILGSGVSLGRKVKIDAGTVVAPDVQIKDGIKVGRGVIIHPHKEIESNIKSGTHVM
jgi:NDP-sugar pyrophosphorylase family protein